MVKLAAKSDKTFHISEKLNGIGLPSSNHLNGHNSIGGYNDTVEDVLNSLTTPNMSNELAYIRLKDFAEYLENLIQTNPNRNMVEIADLIDYGN